MLTTMSVSLSDWLRFGAGVDPGQQDVDPRRGRRRGGERGRREDRARLAAGGRVRSDPDVGVGQRRRRSGCRPGRTTRRRSPASPWTSDGDQPRGRPASRRRPASGGSPVRTGQRRRRRSRSAATAPSSADQDERGHRQRRREQLESELRGSRAKPGSRRRPNARATGIAKTSAERRRPTIPLARAPATGTTGRRPRLGERCGRPPCETSAFKVRPI